MAETTEQYRTRINQLKTSIENEPYMKNMRDDIAEGISKTGNRQADIEEQFQSVIDGTTGKDVISAPEILAARNGEANLNARLIKKEQEFEIELVRNMLNDQQLRAYVDLLQQQVTNMGDISPEPFNTYSDLVSTNPSHAGVYVVAADGNWYYWNSIGSLWDVGGKFISSGVGDGTITTNKLYSQTGTVYSGLIEIDTVKKTFKTTNLFFSYLKDSNVGSGFNELLAYTQATSDVGVILYYDLITKTIKTSTHPHDTITNRHVVLVYLRHGKSWLNSNFISIDGVKVGQSRETFITPIASVGPVFEVDTSTNFGMVNVIGTDKPTIYYKDSYYRIDIEQETVEFDNQFPEYIQTVYLNIPSGLVGVAKHPNRAPYNSVVLFYIRQHQVFGNEKSIILNGKNAWLEKDGSELDWSKNRFLMPDNLYLIKGIDYAISSKIFNYQYVLNSSKLLYDIALPTKSVGFKDTVEINSPIPLDYHTRLIGIYKNDTSKALSKELDIHFTGVDKVEKNPSVLIIGDSITNRNIPYFVKMWLESFGVQANMIGVMQNSTLDTQFPDVLGEGREGWRWTDFTNTTIGGNPIISSDKNRIASNPFINPSTNAFDFDYYMRTQGFSGIDYITISLGTNDLSNYSSFGGSSVATIEGKIANMKNSYDIMEASIHAYDPNIKIAVSPPIPQAVTSNRTEWRDYVEAELNYLKNKESTYALGNYLAVSLMSGKQEHDGGNVFSPINNTKTLSLGENSHDLPNNQIINGLWSASWIMNMLN